MYRFAARAFLIILTVTISFQILNGNNGISLLVNPGITVFAQEGNNKSLELTHGIASGDVTNDSVVTERPKCMWNTILIQTSLNQIP